MPQYGRHNKLPEREVKFGWGDLQNKTLGEIQAAAW